jgi:hypothetical protein
VFGRNSVRISAGSWVILTEESQAFPQSLQTNGGIVRVYRLSHKRFLPNPFHYLVQSAVIQCAFYGVGTEFIIIIINIIIINISVSHRHQRAKWIGNEYRAIKWLSYKHIYLSIYIYGSIALVDLRRFFSFLIYTQSVRLLRWGISPSQRRYLHTEQHKQNKRTQISMPWVGFEPTIPASERASYKPPDWRKAIENHLGNICEHGKINALKRKICVVHLTTLPVSGLHSVEWIR